MNDAGQMGMMGQRQFNEQEGRATSRMKLNGPSWRIERIKNATQGKGSCCPSEFSVYLLGLGRYRLKPSSSGIGYSFRKIRPLKYRPCWLRRPRCAVGPRLGYAVFLQRTVLTTG